MERKSEPAIHFAVPEMTEIEEVERHWAIVDGKPREIFGKTFDQACDVLRLTYWLSGRSEPKIQAPEPLTDPAKCSIEDLEGIIETDPAAAPAYAEELRRRKKREAEIECHESYWDSKKRRRKRRPD